MKSRGLPRLFLFLKQDQMGSSALMQVLRRRIPSAADREHSASVAEGVRV